MMIKPKREYILKCLVCNHGCRKENSLCYEHQPDYQERKLAYIKKYRSTPSGHEKTKLTNRLSASRTRKQKNLVDPIGCA